MYKPCQFVRDEYLSKAKEFDEMQIDDANAELAEFNSDVNDLAVELAYTRYALAKAEKLLNSHNDEQL